MVLSWAHGMASAINGQVDSSDEAGSIRCQEGNAVGHFLHLPWSTEGMGLLAFCKKLAVEKMNRMCL